MPASRVSVINFSYICTAWQMGEPKTNCCRCATSGVLDGAGCRVSPNLHFSTTVMDIVTQILGVYATHQSEVNFLLWCVGVMFFAGTLIVYRIRGKRLREALGEWTRLFEDLDRRVGELTRELMDVRQQLLAAHKKAHQAETDNARLRHDETTLKARIARLESRVKELEQDLARRETELKMLRDADH